MIYWGNINVWGANTQASIAPHPPFGRREPFGAAAFFKDGDVLTPASVKVMIRNDPVNASAHFSFDSAVWIAVFGSSIENKRSTFKAIYGICR